MRAMEISLSALNVEWRRFEVIAENLANANVAAAPGGPVYQERNLISGPVNDFSAYLKGGSGSAAGISTSDLAGVAVRDIAAGNAPPRLVHEPGNPLADARGFVSYPSIDHARQMTDMVETARAYESNIVAMNIAREMYGRALQLGSTN
jgi:flagellar basal-body rod protein FlgC